MTDSGFAEVLRRGGMAPVGSETRGAIDFGLGRIGAGEDDVLEITSAFWQTETQGGDCIAILTRETLCIVLELSRGGLLRRKTTPICVPIALSSVADLIDDDKEMGGPVVYFFGAGESPDFLLRWEQAAERDRFYPCVFAAQRGEFSRWGLQLDPDDYVADFDRFHAEMAASGITEGSALYDWVEDRHGDFRIDNALGFAREWRSRELADMAKPDGRSSRVALIGFPLPWGKVPESHPVFLRLGLQLLEAGLLGPPYDERSFGTDEPLRGLDAGPSRLLALMTLAAYARELADPRAEELIAEARAHLTAVPATVFSPDLRELWADIASLPEPEAPRELDIWEDAEVAEVRAVEEGRTVFLLDPLAAADRGLIEAFLADSGRLDDGSAESYVKAALSGVRAFEGLSPACPPGWRKLLVYNVSDLAHELWRLFGHASEVAMLAQWVTVTIEANGWGPDGNSTPLGQHHSFSMNLAGQTGIGIVVIDPVSGLASVPTGDEARQAAQQAAL